MNAILYQLLVKVGSRTKLNIKKLEDFFEQTFVKNHNCYDEIKDKAGQKVVNT